MGRSSGIALAIVAAGTAAAGHAADGDRCAAAADAYNYTLGTQAIGGRSDVAGSTALPEQAAAIRGLGSNLLKISLAPGAARHYGAVAAANEAKETLGYVQAAPAIRQAFDMDFTYYQAWVHSFTGGNWRDGVNAAEAKAYYDEMYALSAWLLKRYSGSGKVFLLGNWEGDWLLQGRRGGDASPSPQAIRGMTDWLAIRQKAVDDARSRTRHSGVQVYHYVEVNLVRKAMAGRPSLAHSVLPAVNPDLVSYSSYEAIKGTPKPDIDALRRSLTGTVDYLEGQLRPKPGVPFSRRVFIGEYGFHANAAKPATVRDQYERSRQVMHVALELDLPFALIWQLYNNEFAPDGTSKEMGLIDAQGRKRALYHLHREYFGAMRDFVAASCRRSGAQPPRPEFRTRAIEVLDGLPYEAVQGLVGAVATPRPTSVNRNRAD